MDEFDQFAPEPGDGFDGDGDPLSESDPDPVFEGWSEPEAPDTADLDEFDLDEPDPDPEADLDASFDFEADLEDPADDEPAPAETAYAATYEDLLVDQADNPSAFPPELDLDVPEPVDGYPWVDLDALGRAEAEPWVNTVEDSPYGEADLDDPAAAALARFWQR